MYPLPFFASKRFWTRFVASFQRGFCSTANVKRQRTAKKRRPDFTAYHIWWRRSCRWRFCDDFWTLTLSCQASSSWRTFWKTSCVTRRCISATKPCTSKSWTRWRSIRILPKAENDSRTCERCSDHSHKRPNFCRLTCQHLLFDSISWMSFRTEYLLKSEIKHLTL